MCHLPFCIIRFHFFQVLVTFLLSRLVLILVDLLSKQQKSGMEERRDAESCGAKNDQKSG